MAGEESVCISNPALKLRTHTPANDICTSSRRKTPRSAGTQRKKEDDIHAKSSPLAKGHTSATTPSLALNLKIKTPLATSPLPDELERDLTGSVVSPSAGTHPMKEDDIHVKSSPLVKVHTLATTPSLTLNLKIKRPPATWPLPDVLERDLTGSVLSLRGDRSNEGRRHSRQIVALRERTYLGPYDIFDAELQNRKDTCDIAVARRVETRSDRIGVISGQ